MIETNVIPEAHRAGVERLHFQGSSCIYPRLAAQPMAEEALLTGPLELTNEPYAVSKIAGIKLCESYNRHCGSDYRSVMPTTLYGPGDNFHPENSHVIPALMRRFQEAVTAGSPEVVIWGSGQPRRELLHVDDMAEASLFVLDLDPVALAAAVLPRQNHLNIGAGSDVSIRELAALLAEITGFSGQVKVDPDKPDGAPSKQLDSNRLTLLGRQPRRSLREGLEETYRWICANSDRLRLR